MLCTFPDSLARSGANTSGNVIGIPGEHLFLARRTRSGESKGRLIWRQFLTDDKP